MYSINEIKKQNNEHVDKLNAANTTHWITLPAGQIAISVQGEGGVEEKALLDAEQGKGFLKDLANHDGKKALVIHRRAVCRKWVKKAA